MPGPPASKGEGSTLPSPPSRQPSLKWNFCTSSPLPFSCLHPPWCYSWTQAGQAGQSHVAGSPGAGWAGVWARVLWGATRGQRLPASSPWAAAGVPAQLVRANVAGVWRCSAGEAVPDPPPGSVTSELQPAGGGPGGAAPRGGLQATHTGLGGAVSLALWLQGIAFAVGLASASHLEVVWAMLEHLGRTRFLRSALRDTQVGRWQRVGWRCLPQRGCTEDAHWPWDPKVRIWSSR